MGTARCSTVGVGGCSALAAQFLRSRRRAQIQRPPRVLCARTLLPSRETAGTGRVLCDASVAEVVLAPGLLCLLLSEGQVEVYCRQCGPRFPRLCCFDRGNSNHSCVKSLCYNKWDDSIILVSHSLSAQEGLNIEIFDREALKDGRIRRRMTYAALTLQSLAVPFPGFIEFEESNACIVTAAGATYRFWSMRRGYEELFSVDEETYRELRISYGTVAFFKAPKPLELLLDLREIATGKILAAASVPLEPSRELRFLELCSCSLLVKQEGLCLRVFDLLTAGLSGGDSATWSSVANSCNFLPSAVTFLPPAVFDGETPFTGATRFLALHRDSLELCSCRKSTLAVLARVPIIFDPRQSQVLVSSDRGAGSPIVLIYSKPSHSENGAATGVESNRWGKSERMSGPPSESSALPAAASSQISDSLFEDRKASVEGTASRSPAASPAASAKERSLPAGNGLINLLCALNSSKPVLAQVHTPPLDKVNVVEYDEELREVYLGTDRGLFRHQSAFCQLRSTLLSRRQPQHSICTSRKRSAAVQSKSVPIIRFPLWAKETSREPLPGQALPLQRQPPLLPPASRDPLCTF